MLTTAEKYTVMFRCALVAGLFSFLFGTLLLVDYSARVDQDPLNAPQYVALKARLKANPRDDVVKQELRLLDLELRNEYFQRRRFSTWGTWLLVISVAVTLVCAKAAAVLRRRLPQPQPREVPQDLEGYLHGLSRWAVAGMGGLIILGGLGLWASGRSGVDPEGILVADASRSVETSAPSAAIEPSPPKPPAPQQPPPSPAAPELPLSVVVTPPASEPPAPEPPVMEPAPAVPLAAESSAPDDAVPKPAGESPADPATDESWPRNWPRFRGPDGTGVTAYANLPTTWDAASGDGVLWKTAIPLAGNSSPIIWDKRVFLTGADETRRVVYCCDADTGALVWEAEAPGTAESTATPPKVMEATGYAAPTPVTDGQRVYAIFANGDMVAVDFTGQVSWSRSFGLPKNAYGHAASLAMHGERVLVQLDQGTRQDKLSKLLALNAASGEVVWETPREVPNSWTTPIVIEHEGRVQIITAADPWVIAYAPADGQELWRAKCLQADVGPSPTFAKGTVYVANEFPGIAAIRADGTGDVTDSHVLWEADVGAPDTCSPLAVDGLLLVLASFGTLTCYDVNEGGEPLWEEDFDGNFTSSPASSGKSVYLFDEAGKVYVVEPTEAECKRLSEAELGEECVTSPAFQAGRIYIRGKEHLFCLGSPAP